MIKAVVRLKLKIDKLAFIKNTYEQHDKNEGKIGGPAHGARPHCEFLQKRPVFQGAVRKQKNGDGDERICKLIQRRNEQFSP